MNAFDPTAASPLPLADLPPTVTAYLAAHRRNDVDAELALMTAQATVTDEGRTYTGLDEIRSWLDRAAGEYTYTTTSISAANIGDSYVDVVQRLEGDFPGGLVDLHFRFTLNDRAEIADLVIEV